MVKLTVDIKKEKTVQSRRIKMSKAKLEQLFKYLISKDTTSFC